MSKLLIPFTKELRGEVTISGAKNACLPILAASLLVRDKCIISNVPDISDVRNMIFILKETGADIFFDIEKKQVTVNAKNVQGEKLNPFVFYQMRASFLVAGPLISRTNSAKIPLPGGCKIGERPIDLHLDGFNKLGITCIEKKSSEENYVFLKTKKIMPTEIYLDFPSVGATQNIIMASVYSDGITKIKNPAREPEIIDLAMFLNTCGAKITGAGTDTIKITGVENLKGCEYSVIPDRIEAMTYITAGVATDSEIIVKNIISEHIKVYLMKLEEIGASFEIVNENDLEHIKVKKNKFPLKNVDVTTMPYPGFPTDAQSLIMVVLLLAQGESKITETLFENRFMITAELEKLGAKVLVKGDTATVIAGANLKGTEVFATDLRTGAALIITGLISEGETIMSNVFHVQRGYENFIEKFKGLGAELKLIED